ncbi:hypothetical protein AB0K15_34860 [Amycolatopsis sp. NPDC049253]|uniref:hypothetical protein n=1 Tax=Amycolatopsis sp. NPDC049253 TaxID=3155274 RepID=UPI0034204F4A
MSFIDPRLEPIDSALNTAYDRLRELDKNRPPEDGRPLPTDTEAADAYGRAAALAEALAANLRLTEDAFRPRPGALNRRRGGGS